MISSQTFFYLFKHILFLKLALRLTKKQLIDRAHFEITLT